MTFLVSEFQFCSNQRQVWHFYIRLQMQPKVILVLVFGIFQKSSITAIIFSCATKLFFWSALFVHLQLFHCRKISSEPSTNANVWPWRHGSQIAIAVAITIFQNREINSHFVIFNAFFFFGKPTSTDYLTWSNFTIFLKDAQMLMFFVVIKVDKGNSKVWLSQVGQQDFSNLRF